MKNKLFKLLYVITIFFAIIALLNGSSKIEASSDPGVNNLYGANAGNIIAPTGAVGSAIMRFVDIDGTPVASVPRSVDGGADSFIYLELWYLAGNVPTYQLNFKINKPDWVSSLTFDAYENAKPTDDSLSTGSHKDGNPNPILAYLNGVNCGWANTGLTGNILVGRIKFKVNSNGTASSLTLNFGKNPDNIHLSKYTHGSVLSNPVEFTDNNVIGATINFGAASNEIALDSTSTIKGNTESSARNVVVNSGTPYTATFPYESVEAELILNAKAGGTIENVTPSGNGSLTPITAGKSYKVSIGTRGDSVTLVINIKAADGTTGSVTLIVTRNKSDDKLLNTLTYDKTNGMIELYDSSGTNKVSFNSGTLSYKLKVSSAATGLYLEPSVDTSKGTKLEVNNVFHTSGSKFYFTPTAQTINVKVIAENGDTQTYSFVVEVITTNTSLSSMTSSAGTVTINGNNITIDNVPFTESGYKFVPVYGKPGNSAVYGTGRTGAANVSGMSSILFSPNGNSTVQSVITMWIIDCDTLEEEEYTITVNRKAADTNKNLTLSEIIIENDGGTAKTYSLTNNGTNAFKLTDKILYDVRYLKAKVNFTDSTRLVTISINGTSVLNTVFKTGIDIGVTPDTNPTPVTIYIRIYDEGSTTIYTEYTITGEREAAKDDVTINDPVVKGSVTNSNFPADKTDASYDYKYAVDKTDTGANIILTPTDSTVKLEYLIAGGTRQPYTSSGINVTGLASAAKTVTIYVTAQSGKTENYTIYVDRARSNAKDLLTLFIKDSDNKEYITFDPTKYTYTFDVEYAISALNLTSTFSTAATFVTGTIGGKNYKSADNGTVSILSAGTHEFYIQVKAEDGSLGAEYKITVNKKTASTENKLKSILINGVEVDSTDAASANGYQTSKIYEVFLPRSLSSTTATYTISNNATAGSNLVSPITLTAGSRTIYTVTVSSQSGTPATYTFYIFTQDIDYSFTNVKLLTAAGGNDLKNESGTTAYTYDATNTADKTYNITLPFSVKSFFIDVTKVNSNAVIVGGGNVSWSGSSHVVTVYVKSEFGDKNLGITSGTSHSYKITFNITNAAGSNDAALEEVEISFNGNSYKIDNSTGAIPSIINQLIERSSGTATISYKISKDATMTGATSVIIVVGIKETISITVTSQDGNNSTNYTLNLFPASTNSMIDSIELLSGSSGSVMLDNSNQVLYSYVPQLISTLFTLEVPNKYSKGYFKVIPNDINAKIEISETGEFFLFENTVKTVTVTVISEYAKLSGDKSKDTYSAIYTFNLTRDKPDNIITLVEGEIEAYYLDENSVRVDVTLNKSGLNFNISSPLPYYVQNLYVTVTLANGRLAKIRIPADNPASEINSGTLYTHNIGAISTSPTNISLPIYIRSENYANLATYTIKGTRAGADDDNTLNDYYVTGVSTGTPYNDNGEPGLDYKFEIPTTDSSVTLNLSAASTSKIYVSTNLSSLYSSLYNPVTQYAVGTTVYVTVVPEYETAKLTYKFIIEASVIKDNNHDIVSLDVDGKISFNLAQYQYVVNVPYSTKTVNITGEIPASAKWKEVAGQFYKPGMYNIIVGDNIFKFTCIAQDLSSDPIPYEIKVVRAPADSSCDLLGVKINTISLTGPFIDGSTYHYLMPTRAVYNNVKVDFTYSPLAVINQPNPYYFNISAGGDFQFSVRVTSEDGLNSKNYTFKIYSMDNTANLTDIKLLDKAGGTPILNSSGNTAYTFVPLLNDDIIPIDVDYSVSQVYFDVKRTGIYSKINSNGLFSLNEGLNTFEIYVYSEWYDAYSGATNGKSFSYVFEITRAAADTENRLATFSINIDGNPVSGADLSMDLDNSLEIKVKDIDANASTFVFNATPKGKGKIVTTIAPGVINFGSTNGGVYTFTIEVKSEAGVSRIYTVSLSRDNISWDTDNTLKSVEIVGADGITYFAALSFDPTATTPTIINVPGSLISATFTVIANSSKATPSGNGTKTLMTGDNTYIVFATAEDGTKGKEYTFILKKPALDTDNTLSKITVDNVDIPGIDPYVPSNAKLYVPNSTNSINLDAFTKSTKANVKATDLGVKSLTVGENIFTIQVDAENGSTKVYTIYIYRDEVSSLQELKVAKDNDPSEVYALAPNFSSNTFNYTVKVPYTTDKVNITYLLNAVDATLINVTGAGIVSLNVGNNTVEIVVTPKTGNANATTYTLLIERESAKQGNYLETIEINYGDYIYSTYDKTKNTHIIVLDRTISFFNITDYTVSDGATITSMFSDKTLLPNVFNEKKVIVTSQSGENRTYTFRVATACTIFDLDSIVLQDQSGNILLNSSNNVAMTFDKNTLTYNISVPYDVSIVNFIVTPKSNFATVSETPGFKTLALPNVTKSFTFEVTSEYGIINPTANNIKSSKYTINITRESQNSDDTLKELEVVINGKNEIINFDPTKLVYTIENIGIASSINIIGVPNALTSTVTGTGNKVLNSTNSYNFSFPVTVTAEDGTVKVYEIYIARGPLNENDDNTINDLQLYDSLNKHYITNFDVTKFLYQVTIPFGPTAYTINPILVSGSPAVISGGGQFVINASNLGTTVTHHVCATSKSGVQGQVYTIEVTIEKPSSDNTLLELKADGVLVPGFNPNGGSYTLNRIYEVTSIVITAKSNDKFTVIKGTGTFVLQEGLNTFVVTSTSQDGIPAIHTINVYRAYAAPYLLNLGVNGEKLLDINKKAVNFEPDNYTYYVIVPYYKSVAEIFAQLNDVNDIVIGVGEKNLDVGLNIYTVTVISPNSTQSTYTLNISRQSELAANAEVNTANIKTLFIGGSSPLKPFNDEFDPETTKYGPYTVPNKVVALDVLFVPYNNVGNFEVGPATVEYYNHENLQVGLNTVFIVVTAADGVSTKTYIIKVERIAMSYEIDKGANPDVVFEDVPDEHLVFTADLGKKRASDVDFSDYIKINDKDLSLTKIEVLTDLSNNPSEVLIKVSDGTNSDIVKILVSYDKVKELKYDMEDGNNVVVSPNNTDTDRFTVNIGNKNVDEINYSDLITVISSEGDYNIDILTDLSDNPSQIVIKLTDDFATKIITLDINRTPTFTDTVKDSFLWILLIVICAIILTAILISVRKDKYGKITKRATR